MSRPWLFLSAILSMLVALVSWRFLALGMGPAFPAFVDHIAQRPLAFAMHVALGPLALALGAVQFFPALRAARPRLHRWIGRTYVASCLLSAAAAAWLAPSAIGGPVAGMGFGLLAALWIGTTAEALRHALRRDFARHRRWMIRSFALTFAAVTLRLQLPVFDLFGLTYPEASVILAWSAWLPNLAFAEWLLRRPAAAPRIAPAIARKAGP